MKKLNFSDAMTLIYFACGVAIFCLIVWAKITHANKEQECSDACSPFAYHLIEEKCYCYSSDGSLNPMDNKVSVGYTEK